MLSRLIYCPVCGKKGNRVISAHQPENGLTEEIYSPLNKFHCSRCDKHMEFRIVWDWDTNRELE